MEFRDQPPERIHVIVLRSGPQRFNSIDALIAGNHYDYRGADNVKAVIFFVRWTKSGPSIVRDVTETLKCWLRPLKGERRAELQYRNANAPLYRSEALPQGGSEQRQRAGSLKLRH